MRRRLAVNRSLETCVAYIKPKLYRTANRGSAILLENAVPFIVNQWGDREKQRPGPRLSEYNFDPKIKYHYVETTVLEGHDELYCTCNNLIASVGRLL